MFPLLAAAPALVFPALVLTGAVKDLLTFTIPNWISLAMLAAFPVAALASGLTIPAIGVSFAVGVAALVLGMGMFALRWIGGGDAKLFAAAALWLGWTAAPTFLLATALAGGGLALTLLALRAPAWRPYLLLGPRWMSRLAEPQEDVPYGVAIAVGALAAYPLTPFVTGLAL
jgi:prepilin peptidase CpaA